jgi:hypothetical protein
MPSRDRHPFEPLVHARIEALLNDEADKSARERSLELIRGALGDEVAEMVLAETVSSSYCLLAAMGITGLFHPAFSSHVMSSQML